MKVSIDGTLREHLIRGVLAAGRQVMDIYEGEYEISYKGDASPLTEADMAAHCALVALLKEHTPDVPILSEESEEIPYSRRKGWRRYWLLDPLDGTKEFIGHTGEFTINVALIEEGVPMFGIVHAPVLDTTWWGQAGVGAFKRVGGDEQAIQVRALPEPEQEAWKVVGSRRHGAGAFQAFCDALPNNERVSMGSSLKLCLVAEGKADLYPRLAPTSEWDTAAAQAVVTAAGGEVLEAHTLQPLRCNQKENPLNPWFIVCGQRDERWEQALADALPG
ncbi:3'(2'),5'-bisphosphate nucleotidase CysQ [Litchfieldella xinjiangensis]|uniref:3'(2'),5'-bisphosphate nucleotidase CysQ n=1 Tax=Litchfieldella xinjiangensis TaxID=1166948 RepID=UPI0005BDE9C7|nr:3'(2'),5'-bisphosphate nucleotidase CysQ [Halomonas xinjiangensis]